VPLVLGSDFYDPPMYSTRNTVESSVCGGGYVGAFLTEFFRQGRVNKRYSASRPFSFVTRNEATTTSALDHSAAALSALGSSPALAFEWQFSNTSQVSNNR
jgi:hypothetical protein